MCLRATGQMEIFLAAVYKILRYFWTALPVKGLQSRERAKKRQVVSEGGSKSGKTSRRQTIKKCPICVKSTLIRLIKFCFLLDVVPPRSIFIFSFSFNRWIFFVRVGGENGGRRKKEGFVSPLWWQLTAAFVNCWLDLRKIFRRSISDAAFNC